MTAQTKQTTDEKIREAVKAPLKSEVSTSDIVAGFISSTKLEEIVYDIKQLINSEVLSVLEELESKYGEFSDDTLGERKNYKAVAFNDIQSIKNRYKL